MTILEIILIAIGLSMDSFAVSLTSGVIMRSIILWKAIKIAFFMALFQAGMPLIGWYAGINFKSHIENYDHWIAFGVLCLLGSKMIWEAIRADDTENENNATIDPSKTKTLIALSLATSIDALAVGVSLAFLNISMTLPTIIIGSTTFIASLIAVYLGKLLGDKIKSKAELLGGVILILIGVKIVIEHLYLSPVC